MMNKQHIFLIGMMGSGKSAVGIELADLLHYNFIDLDQKIIENAGKSIERIFSEDGESAFRREESRTAFDLDMSIPSVIATGGGFPLKKENRDWMELNGVIVWLKSSPEVILERIKDENRPLLPKPISIEHIKNILDARIGIYDQAGLTIDTDEMTPAGIAREIEKVAG